MYEIVVYWEDPAKIIQVEIYKLGVLRNFWEHPVTPYRGTESQFITRISEDNCGRADRLYLWFLNKGQMTR